MGLFSTRNSDGASGKGESANTISKKEWEKLQASARKNAPRLGSKTDVAATKRAAANYHKRHQN